jgi:hypothetical protein
MTDTYVVGSTGKAVITKDPREVLDYTFDWTDYLTPISDTLISKTVTVDVGLTLNSSSLVGSMVSAFISGGTTGTTYRVICQVVTAGGRTADRSIYIKCVER